MPWSDVLSTFDGVYLSWNPEMWPKNLIEYSLDLTYMTACGNEEDRMSNVRSLVFYYRMDHINNVPLYSILGSFALDI